MDLTRVHCFIVSLHEAGGNICMREILSSSEALTEVHLHGTFSSPFVKKYTIKMIHAGTTSHTYQCVGQSIASKSLEHPPNIPTQHFHQLPEP